MSWPLIATIVSLRFFHKANIRRLGVKGFKPLLDILTDTYYRSGTVRPCHPLKLCVSSLVFGSSGMLKRMSLAALFYSSLPTHYQAK